MFCTVSRCWSVSLLLPAIKFLPTLYIITQGCYIPVIFAKGKYGATFLPSLVR